MDLHLLDDGFSHVGLAREVDIVLLDATAPDAGGALLPAGLLREPLTSLARADLIVVTKTEQADPAAALELARRYAPGVPVFHARTVLLGIRDREGRSVDPADLPAGTTVAVAGIARPGSFRATLDAAGVVPADFLAFRDHEPYGPATVGRIERALEETGATAVVTTEKDAVKLDTALRAPGLPRGRRGARSSSPPSCPRSSPSCRGGPRSRGIEEKPPPEPDRAGGLPRPPEPVPDPSPPPRRRPRPERRPPLPARRPPPPAARRPKPRARLPGEVPRRGRPAGPGGLRPLRRPRRGPLPLRDGAGRAASLPNRDRRPRARPRGRRLGTGGLLLHAPPRELGVGRARHGRPAASP